MCALVTGVQTCALPISVERPVDELREGAHADHVDVAAEHLRHLGDVLLGLAVHHRAQVELDRPGVLARLQHHRVPAQLERAQLEAGAGAQRAIEEQIGRAHVCTPDTNTQLVCRLLLEKKQNKQEGITVNNKEIVSHRLIKYTLAMKYI